MKILNNLVLIKAELLRLFGDLKSYKLNFVTANLNYLLLFIGLFYGTGMYENNEQNSIYFVLGLIIWSYAVSAIQSVAVIIQQEAQTGVIEQAVMTKSKYTSILLSRLVASFIFDTIQLAIIFTIFSLLFSLFATFISCINFINVLIITIVIVTGLIGIGFIVAGFSIIYKKTQAVARATTNFLLFFSGIIIPFETLPPVIRVVSSIFPIHIGMKIIKASVYNVSTLELLLNIDFYFLIILCISWFLFGMFFFNHLFNNALTKGNLAHY